MRKIDIVICAALTALVWSVFGQTLTHDFVNYDDRVYVTQNPPVANGLTTAGIGWAFTHAHAGNWHPLTTISHMVDCQLFGLKPGAHHAVNVVLHTGAVLLLFAFLRLTTATIWPSAFVAAVFAIHPLRVESVAWIAERKDVLSAAFFMVALIAYTRYVRSGSLGRYITMSILSACAMMSKPMLVTLPFVFLIADRWPLARSTSAKLIIEKLPLFAFAIAVSIVTIIVQRHSPGAIVSLPLPWRLENAAVSYLSYIGQMFWPNDLIVFYPHPEGQLPSWQWAGAVIVLLGISVAAWRFRLTKPYLLAGWLWYIAMLLPVIGLVGFGLQGHADRYTYLPQIGLGIAITWLIVDLTSSIRWQRTLLAIASLLIVALLGACAWKQTTFWRNSETLWSHALAISPQNPVAQANMGIVLLERGRPDDAIAHLQTALNLSANTPPHALSLALIHTNLGFAFAERGDVDLAINHLRNAIELEPQYPEAHYDLAVVTLQRGDVDLATNEFEKTIELRPDDVDARISLAGALVQRHRLTDAIAQYDEALQRAPRAAFAANNLAWILATAPNDSLRNGARAVTLAQIANSSDPRNPIFARTLSAALAENGRFEEARAASVQAAAFARANHDVDLAREIEEDSELFARQQTLRSPSLTNAP